MKFISANMFRNSKKTGKKRVLLLADECNPDWPSLPVVGYKTCRAIAEYADVTVATNIRNKPQIDRDGFGKADVVFIDNGYISKPMDAVSNYLRGGNTVAWTTRVALEYPSYIAFEREVFRRFAKDLTEDGTGFDVVHRVTPMTPTLPSPMASWSKVPFIIGPLNGGLKWPAGFTAELRREREWMTYLRGLHKVMPYAHTTYRDAALILAAFQHTIDALPARCRDRIVDFPEVGIDPELFNHGELDEKQREAPLTFLFVGRLVPYKCADIVVSAFASSEKLRKHKLKIVGAGPEKLTLQALIVKENAGASIELLGSRTQQEVGELMRNADVFAFPSIRELGAGVVVEAMASGLPTIAVDYGGPAGLITNGRDGVKVPIGIKSELTAHFKREMELLAEDRDRRRMLGAQARQSASALTWDAKAQKIVEFYEFVLQNSRSNASARASSIARGGLANASRP